MNLHHDKEAFVELIIGAANELAIPANIIEKDYYVTITLKALSNGIILKFSIAIEDKTKYEFVTVEENKYVVLSEHEDKILIVPYEINENGQYVFNTSKYWFCEKYQGTYKYIDMEICPKVIKDGEAVP